MSSSYRHYNQIRRGHRRRYNRNRYIDGFEQRQQQEASSNHSISSQSLEYYWSTAFVKNSFSGIYFFKASIESLLDAEKTICILQQHAAKCEEMIHDLDLEAPKAPDILPTLERQSDQAQAESERLGLETLVNMNLMLNRWDNITLLYQRHFDELVRTIPSSSSLWQTLGQVSSSEAMANSEIPGINLSTQ
ncbi:hypothetical protein EMCG_07744 [[Emmonsia] crescens]|uniref:Uncharacterized protein n=1 Tax=[Emmonsia] crescens TaxID=73230 RepID=A0A0G2I8F1_9EURO|nr:hypothetical protein EMCG_07744 [Emmonsia crescens UAMH 3008]